MKQHHSFFVHTRKRLHSPGATPTDCIRQVPNGARSKLQSAPGFASQGNSSPAYIGATPGQTLLGTGRLDHRPPLKMSLFAQDQSFITPTQPNPAPFGKGVMGFCGLLGALVRRWAHPWVRHLQDLPQRDL